MSLELNVFNSSTKSKKTSSKTKLNILWKRFMSCFGYQKYYNNISKEEINISSSYQLIDNNNDSTDNSIKLFLDFLQENSISPIEDKTYNLISNDKKGDEILSEAKIWIMFIIYITQNNSKEKNFLNVMNIFKEAIKNECDIISLFEFFLIFISKINENYFCINFNIDKINELMPKEFIVLYEQKKHILKNIFRKDIDNNNNNIDMRNSLKKFLTNDIMTNSNDTLFSSNKKEKEKLNKINLDFNDIIIISKDYLNKGYFFIFQNKKDNKGNEILNSFMNDEFEDYEDDYCLMPLLDKYQNYEQKMDANKILILINKSIYKNYTYFPHDKNIINRL